MYPDIAAAVKCGGLDMELNHYRSRGFREGVRRFRFDLRWYSVAYSDAAYAVGEGEYRNLIHHYVEEDAAKATRQAGRSEGASAWVVNWCSRQARDDQELRR